MDSIQEKGDPKKKSPERIDTLGGGGGPRADGPQMAFEQYLGKSRGGKEVEAPGGQIST